MNEINGQLLASGIGRGYIKMGTKSTHIVRL